MARSSLPLAWTMTLLAGCSSEPRVLDIEVVTGHETDAMTQDPPVTNVVVKGTTPEGETIEAEAPPGGTLDFGEVDGSGAYSFQATGYDGAGNVVMRGNALGFVLDQFPYGTLQIFVQRLGAWARPPDELFHTHTRAPAVNFGLFNLALTGGDAEEDTTKTDTYDLPALAGSQFVPLPFAARTLLTFRTPSGEEAMMALGSDDAGEMAVLTFDGTIAQDTPLPEGLTSFGEVAGGSVVRSFDGRTFIVGATRSSSATDAVLEIAADGSLIARRLVHERAGAAAVWVDTVGLVVAGGSAEGPGVEVLGEEATTFATRDFPADATMGAAAVKPYSFDDVVLFGGITGDTGAPTRILDPRCTSHCTLEESALATPGTALARTAAYSLGQGRLIAVGDEPAPPGVTHTFVADYLAGSITELPLREPRAGATPIPSPIGTLVLMGGVHLDGTPALTVEMFFPE